VTGQASRSRVAEHGRSGEDHALTPDTPARRPARPRVARSGGAIPPARAPAPAPCQAPRRMGIGHNRPHAGPRIRRCLRPATWPHPAARLLPIVKIHRLGRCPAGDPHAIQLSQTNGYVRDGPQEGMMRDAKAAPAIKERTRSSTWDRPAVCSTRSAPGRDPGRPLSR